jgi:glycosyltransferase involved in cell wall biosynthesis
MLSCEDWDSVHCHDLDTLPIGYVHTRRQDIPLVFDAHESYPDLIARQTPAWAGVMIRWLERFLVRRVDALVTVGDLLAEHYRPWAARVVVVRNCQQPGPVQPALVSQRSERRPQGTELVVCYVGGFTRGRVILPLIEAVANDPTVGLLLVGEGPQAEALLEAIGDLERIVYLGPRVPPDQVVNLMKSADVVYYGLRSDYPNNRFSSPNALYGALEAGRPLLTTNVGEISLIVRDEGCGLVLGEPTVEAIGLALTELRDVEVRAGMARRAEYAARTKYNWKTSETRLLGLYRDLWGDA